MICPKCGKDAGEAKFCPECGTNLVVLSERNDRPESEQEMNPDITNKTSKKKIKKAWLLLAALIALGGFFGITGAVKSAKKDAPEAPATYVDWLTIYHDYQDNGQTATEKHAKQKNLFYVYIDQIDSIDTTVTFYEQNWERSEVPFLNKHSCHVRFNDYSKIHTGHYYVVEGNISYLWIDSDKFISYVEISNANVVSEIK